MNGSTSNLLISQLTKISPQMAVDPVSLIALFVALIALLVALLQVLQQYASTAYDYRRCSSRTMGGWARYTSLKFILREVRFDVTFLVPHLELDRYSPCV